VTPRPAIAVVIPARNNAATIEKAVRAAKAQRDAGAPEVIVVDDGSTDDTARRARDAGARVVPNAGRGPAAGRNTGWRAASADVVAFTDSDCIPNPDWCARILSALADTDVGAVGGSYDIANSESPLARVVHAEIMARHDAMEPEVRALGTYNFAARREVLEELNGFNEDYLAASGEDNDISYRILKTGRKLLFLRENTVAHHHPTRLWPYLKSQARHGFWRVKLYLDHPDMKSGDDYSGVADYLAPVFGLLALVAPALGLALAALGAIIGRTSLLWFGVGAIAVSLLSAAAATLCSLPLVKPIRKLGYNREGAVFPWLSGLRASARGWGMLLGAAHFGLLRKGKRT